MIPWFWIAYYGLCAGIGAVIQCRFLHDFCDIKKQWGNYGIYLALCFLEYFLVISVDDTLSPILNTLVGAGIVVLFLNRLLKQNYLISTIAATLTVAVMALCESVLFLMESALIQAGNVPQTVIWAGGSLFSLILSYAMYRFFVVRYSVKSPYRSRYLLGFSLPICFVSLVLRTVNQGEYTITENSVIAHTEKIGNGDFMILTVLGFACICAVLLAYEKTLGQFQTEYEKAQIEIQLAVHKRYVEEARKKYETTRTFRHDFKNHMIALEGLIRRGEIEKSTAYLKRFEQIQEEMTFLVSTGNEALDILLGDKLGYARQQGIQIRQDIMVPEQMKIQDFDLCAIFANCMDNAIKGCNSVEQGEKEIDITAKFSGKFFVIDIRNNYEADLVPAGDGIGLKTVQNIVERYRGEMEICEAENQFCISILLPGNACAP